MTVTPITAANAIFEQDASVFAFTTQPVSGTAKTTEPYTFTWALNGTPDSIYLQRWWPNDNMWATGKDLNGLTSSEERYIDVLVDGNISKYRIRAIKGSDTIYSNEFTVTWTEDGTPHSRFKDVSDSAYYADAVKWAVDHDPQITNGTGADTFSPDATCTRGQVVTFLWRAAGCPAPADTSAKFTDVSSSAYYNDAVLWAVEKGITNGTSASTFSPDRTCTRGQIVTFLYRDMK